MNAAKINTISINHEVGTTNPKTYNISKYIIYVRKELINRLITTSKIIFKYFILSSPYIYNILKLYKKVNHKNKRG
jgi:hypothetical protein